MRNFRAYCGLTLLLLAVIIFQPFLMMIESNIDINSISPSILDPPLLFTDHEYKGYEYWGAFVFPVVSTLVILIIANWRNLWTAILGVVMCFGSALWTIGIIPGLYRNGFLADGQLLAGYDYLRVTVVLFLILNISNAIAIYRNPEAKKKKIKNVDVLDDF